MKEDLFTKNKFENLNLSAHLTDCLEKRFKLKKMTQIQEKTIPALMEGKDCFVKSQTGSGKTLAYAIPIVQQLQAKIPRMKRTDGIKALVLVPTRELAIQTCQVFEQLCNVNIFKIFITLHIFIIDKFLFKGMCMDSCWLFNWWYEKKIRKRSNSTWFKYSCSYTRSLMRSFRYNDCS